MTITVRMLDRDEAAVLDRIAEDVFDEPVNARWAAEFLGDPRHHLAVAVAGEQVVGFASGVHYVHPDKPPELWVNEVGVAPPYQNQGSGVGSSRRSSHEAGRSGVSMDGWAPKWAMRRLGAYTRR